MQRQVGKTDQIPDSIYTIAAVATVMMSHDEAPIMTNDDRIVKRTIYIKKKYLEYMESEGLDLDTHINKLLEFFILAHKAFWGRIEEIMLRPGFEPGSPARKAGMIGRATPPELNPSIRTFV